MTRRQSQPVRGDLQHRRTDAGRHAGREICRDASRTARQDTRHRSTPGQPGRKYQSGTKPGGARLTGDTRTGARDLPGQARTAAAAHYRRRSLSEILDSGREKNRKKRKRVITILIFPKYSPPCPGRRRQG